MTGVQTCALPIYALVTTGAVLPSLRVNGQAVTPAAFTRQPGADYTLMVYGTPAAPRTAWIVDNNRLPAGGTGATQANIRLVNGLADLDTPLSMTVDALPLGAPVAPGAATSPPLLVGPTSGGSIDGRVAVTAQGVTAPVFSGTAELRAAGVYSVFVVGRASAATGIVRRDR